MSGWPNMPPFPGPFTHWSNAQQESQSEQSSQSNNRHSGKAILSRDASTATSPPTHSPASSTRLLSKARIIVLHSAGPNTLGHHKEVIIKTFVLDTMVYERLLNQRPRMSKKDIEGAARGAHAREGWRVLEEFVEIMGQRGMKFGLWM